MQHTCFIDSFYEQVVTLATKYTIKAKMDETHDYNWTKNDNKKGVFVTFCLPFRRSLDLN